MGGPSMWWLTSSGERSACCVVGAPRDSSQPTRSARATRGSLAYGLSAVMMDQFSRSGRASLGLGALPSSSASCTFPEASVRLPHSTSVRSPVSPRISWTGDREVEPTRLEATRGLSFHGSKIYGEGFTFDDDKLKGLATPIAEMRRLIENDARNAERIRPYIGGEELNSDPRQMNRRFVISFGRMTEDEARRWPDLMLIVENRVRPQRSGMHGYALADRRREYWWQFETYAQALHEAIAPLTRCLALSRVSAHLSLAFQPTDRVFADSLVVFPFENHAPFAVLQSRAHEIWARFFGSSMKDDLRYSPSDCFDNFPTPAGWLVDAGLESVGQAYADPRAAHGCIGRRPD